jgi:hypothetical protein
MKFTASLVLVISLFVLVLMCINSSVASSDTINECLKRCNCTYERKDKTLALTYSIAIGIYGADWFYLSNGNGAYILSGVIKMIFGLLFSIMIGVHIINLFSEQYRGKKAYELNEKLYEYIWIFFVVAFITLGWYVIDMYRLLYNIFRDGNCIDLNK